MTTASAPRDGGPAGGALVRRRRRRTVGFLVVLAAALLAGGLGCSDDGDDREGGGADEAVEGGGEGTSEGGAEVGDPELQQELVEMQQADQAERTGELVDEWDDVGRAQRLEEIIDEHGWPTRDLVGADGATAAWLIAQHADHDVEFQERALGLMREAVEAGQADPSELAYLDDRVATNRGRPQTYGTQIGCVDGQAEPGELADPGRVDELREEVGLEPLATYLAELEEACAAEAAG